MAKQEFEDYEWGVGKPPAAAAKAKYSIWVRHNNQTVVLATFPSKAKCQMFVDLAGGVLAEGITPERLASVVSEIVS